MSRPDLVPTQYLVVKAVVVRSKPLVLILLNGQEGLEIYLHKKVKAGSRSHWMLCSRVFKFAVLIIWHHYRLLPAIVVSMFQSFMVTCYNVIVIFLWHFRQLDWDRQHDWQVAFYHCCAISQLTEARCCIWNVTILQSFNVFYAFKMLLSF
jgi:hypothetical protein